MTADGRRQPPFRHPGDRPAWRAPTRPVSYRHRVRDHKRLRRRDVCAEQPTGAQSRHRDCAFCTTGDRSSAPTLTSCARPIPTDQSMSMGTDNALAMLSSAVKLCRVTWCRGRLRCVLAGELQSLDVGSVIFRAAPRRSAGLARHKRTRMRLEIDRRPLQVQSDLVAIEVRHGLRS